MIWSLFIPLLPSSDLSFSLSLQLVFFLFSFFSSLQTHRGMDISLFLPNIYWMSAICQTLYVTNTLLTSSVYCIVLALPHVKSPSINIYPPFILSYLSPSLFSSCNHRTVVCLSFVFCCYFYFLFLLHPFTFSAQPQPSSLLAALYLNLFLFVH